MEISLYMREKKKLLRVIIMQSFCGLALLVALTPMSIDSYVAYVLCYIDQQNLLMEIIDEIYAHRRERERAHANNIGSNSNLIPDLC